MRQWYVIPAVFSWHSSTDGFVNLGPWHYGSVTGTSERHAVPEGRDVVLSSRKAPDESPSKCGRASLDCLCILWSRASWSTFRAWRTL